MSRAHSPRVKGRSFFRRRAGRLLHDLIGGEVALAPEVNEEAEDHADAGRAEAPRPVLVPRRVFALAEGAADERGEPRAEVDAHVEDVEGAVATLVPLGVEGPDLRGDVRLEEAATDAERGEGGEKESVPHQHELAEDHDDAAENDRLALAEDAVGEDPAEERCQVDQRGVEAIDLVGELLVVEVAEDVLERAAHDREAGDGLDDAGEREVLRHVEDQERAHAVVAKALPHLGEEEDREADRVAEELAGGRGAGGRAGGGGHGGVQ